MTRSADKLSNISKANCKKDIGNKNLGKRTRKQKDQNDYGEITGDIKTSSILSQ